MSAHDFPRLFHVCPAKLVGFLCLCLVLEEFKRPHDPEGCRRHHTCRKELPEASVHELSMAPAEVQHADEVGKETDIACQYDPEALVDLAITP